MSIDLASRELRIVGPDNDTVLDLRPIQGLWTEEQYLAMTNHTCAPPSATIIRPESGVFGKGLVFQ
jgi:hypothetical protein